MPDGIDRKLIDQSCEAQHSPVAQNHFGAVDIDLLGKRRELSSEQLPQRHALLRSSRNSPIRCGLEEALELLDSWDAIIIRHNAPSKHILRSNPRFTLTTIKKNSMMG